MAQKPVIDISCDADVIDKVAFNKRAVEMFQKVHSRSDDERKTAFEKRQALSAIGGVAELNAIEGEYYVLNVYRDSPVLDFVEMRDLPLGSVPIYRTRTINPVGFYQGNINAMGSTLHYATNDAGYQVTTFAVSTEEIEVPNLNAIYDMARLGQRQAALERLAHDMQIAITNVCLNTMFRSTANGGSSVVTDDPATSITNYYTNQGTFAGKTVFVLDPGVQSSSMPSTNIFNLTSEGGLTKNVYQTINDFRLKSKRRIRKLYVPAADGGTPVWRAMQNEAAIVSAVSGTGNNDPKNSITPRRWEEFDNIDFAGTVTVNWFGLNIDIEVCNWLPAGYCFFLTDRPAVVFWDRLNLATGQDLAGTLEVPVNGYNSRRSETRQIGAISPDFCLLNFGVLKVA